MIRVIAFILCTTACANAQVPMYKVDKIKTVGKFYIIYAVKDDSTYKIVSRKEKTSDGTRIRKNQSYPFKIAIILF